MADKITPQSKDFSEWYHDVVIQSRLADHSPVKGCMVIRPNGYAIWEQIQKELNQRIKATGVRNAYFPLFIPESFLNKEKEHVEGFAPECAVVTYAGKKNLEERLVVRPTSETIINSMFSKWIQSYRDLPLMINQWANVVRWEMRTRLFLRTTEFLWQEGHTCHSTGDEAELKAREILRLYERFAAEVMAMPVVAGLKSEGERFAGALRTYTVEAMMQDTKALQAGTSHNLSTNFAHAFNTEFLDSDGQKKPVHQTSWGVSTRLIGGMVMMHSDDRGLVLPPRLATTHVVIIPFFPKAKSASEGQPDLKSMLLEKAHSLKVAICEAASQSDLPYEVGVDLDLDETKQAGWKFHEYELIGTPIRVELGPRDLEKNQAVVVQRDLGVKQMIPLGQLPDLIISELKAMQIRLYEKAVLFQKSHTFEVTDYDDFKIRIKEKGGFYIAPWCQKTACEEKVKQDTKATLRCLPLNNEYEPIAVKTPGATCMICSSSHSLVRAVFARNY